MGNCLKFIKCCITGHELGSNICKTINSNNLIRKCNVCGFYIMHGDIGSVVLTKKSAFKVKNDFEKEFPYAKERDHNAKV